MKKAYIFPGQGSQFEGMGKALYESNNLAKPLFEKANEILGFEITKTMFEGSAEELKATKVTQPAIYIYTVVATKLLGNNFMPDMLAGHSLGEISALAAANVVSFEDGLQLVAKRANAMQIACEENPSTMAAILALENEVVEKICAETEGVVVAANYNCPGQIVISGEITAVEIACEKLKEAGARRALILPVGGAFHSPLMAAAQNSLAKAIENTTFNKPRCAVYQNYTAKPETNADQLKENLNKQLTAPVLWMQSISNMVANGATHFYEIGPGKVLTGLMRKIDRSVEASKID